MISNIGPTTLSGLANNKIRGTQPVRPEPVEGPPAETWFDKLTMNVDGMSGRAYGKRYRLRAVDDGPVERHSAVEKWFDKLTTNGVGLS